MASRSLLRRSIELGLVVSLCLVGYLAYQLFTLNLFSDKDSDHLVAEAEQVFWAAWQRQQQGIQADAEALLSQLAGASDESINRELMHFLRQHALIESLRLDQQTTGGGVCQWQYQASASRFIENCAKAPAISASDSGWQHRVVESEQPQFIWQLTSDTSQWRRLTLTLPTVPLMKQLSQSTDFLSYFYAIGPLGRVIFHPQQRYVGLEAAELSLIEETFQVVNASASYFDSYLMSLPHTGQLLGLSMVAPGSENWRLITVRALSLDRDSRRLQHRYHMMLVPTLLVGLLFYGMLVLRSADGDFYELQHLILLFSMAAFVSILVIWAIQINTPESISDHEYVVRDAPGLAQMANQVEAQQKTGNQPLRWRLPTGINVETIEFMDDNTVQLSGLLWMVGVPSMDLAQLTPEFSAAKTATLKLYQQRDNMLIWRFDVALRQPLSFDQYPFERGRVSLAIGLKGFVTDTLLVPDLSAYRLTNPIALPGLADHLEMPGWRLFQSYFSYQMQSNNGALMALDPLYYGQLPVLHFHVDIGRKFLSPFITDMIPIMIIVSLLFMVTLTMTSDEERSERLGYSTSDVLAYTSGLFFVLIVSHVYLREKLNLENIVYIEVFYFLMYFVILSISICAVLFSSAWPTPLLDYRDGAIVKMCYWPVVLGLALVSTFWFFY